MDVRRVVLVLGRQLATEWAAGGVRNVPVRELRDYRGFSARVAEVLGAELKVRSGEAPPRELGQDDGLVLCPWPVAVKWFDRGGARRDARRCVVIDGDEEWLVERGAPWSLAAAVDSASLSRWEHGSPFPYPVVVGRADAAVEIGATLPSPENWRQGYTSFTHSGTTDVVDLLVQYLTAVERLDA